ncbi:uncharacterized protein LOC127572661 [Pristis pectinata]|uniref:uncharacterized protein LOC127572661 n=1 Tax=Pristis pectinata TaxID=685728 RepID=UPI00223CAF56|nr:uncharacterized protein LOC127572661 [Pristis pectinata]
MGLSLLLLLILARADGSCISNWLEGERGNILAVQWPPKICEVRNWNSPACNLKQWTIHGWWPPESGKETNKYQFDVNKIKDLRKALNQLWPSLSSEDNVRFWKQEWYRHGKKAVRRLTVCQYFKQTLDYYNKFVGNCKKTCPEDIKRCLHNQSNMTYNSIRMCTSPNAGELHLMLPNNFI